MTKTPKAGLLGLVVICSVALTGCGITPPPVPSGERVPINHVPGQWSPSKNRKELHETPQEKAERLRVERLKRAKAEAEAEAARKAQEARSATTAVATPVEQKAVGADRI